jgi:hypothetical protein
MMLPFNSGSRRRNAGLGAGTCVVVPNVCAAKIVQYASVKNHFQQIKNGKHSGPNN